MNALTSRQYFFDMQQFSHIIFDLDGTLTDNTSGIINSLKYALDRMQINNYPEDILDRFIGPPLQWGFSELFGLNEKNTKLAVEHFREYYSQNGWHQNEPYDGISELLAELDQQGKRLYIATSKLEKYARQIVEHFEFDKYITALKGADYKGKKAEKTTIITDLMNSQGIIPSENVVMVGDTLFDINGGKENEISTVAVAYGFGKTDELQQAEPNYFVEDVDELYEILSL